MLYIIIKRMDLDTTRRKNAFSEIISEFTSGKIDILVGTQMVTKGLDFENILLVAVVNADTLLYYPDFRAFERAFQELTQVSGRDSPYYRLVILPALVIPFVRFFDLLWRLYGHGKTQRKNDALVVLSCLLMVGAAAVHRYRSNLQNPEDVVVVRYVKENTEQTDTILTIGNYAWPYIAADRTTENRFFFQWPPIQVSDALYEEFLEELRVHPSDFVILPEAENSELQIPGEGKIDDALSMLEEMGYQKEQYDGFRVYLAPGKTDGNQ